MAARKTVLIVDDHAFVREGLKSVIGASPGFEVSGEAATGAEALSLAQRLKPDLILMDLSLPDASGLEIIGQLRSARIKARIIVLTMHSKTDFIARAFEAGATGYIVKESACERLVPAMKSVLDGEYYLDSAVSRKVVEKLMRTPAEQVKIKDRKYEALSAREQEILALTAEGLTNDQIADRLFISRKTVKNHRANIMQKLDLHNTHELIRYAARLGLIDLDLWKG